MVTQIVDAVGIVNRTVLFLGVERAEAVLNNKQGFLIAVVDLVERDAQTQRVDLPAPVGSLEVGVFSAEGHVAGGHFLFGSGADDHRHVVREGDKVNGALAELLKLIALNIQLDAFSLILFEFECGIIAACVNVHVEEGAVVHRLNV